MKQILTLIAVFAILTGYSQECHVTALGLSYAAPKGASVEFIYTGKFQGGMGIMYNSFTTKEKGSLGQGGNIDLMAYGGYRVFHREYRTAVYTCAGYLMGDVYGPRLYLSTKFMLLRDQKAFCLEPYYANRWGLKIGIYKII